MGDRVLFVVRTVAEGPVATVYGHWSGARALVYGHSLANRMKGREGDVQYATARLVGILHEAIDGNLSLGVMPPPADTKPATLTAFSHGDAGVILIDALTFKAKAYGGYWGEDGKEYDLTKPQKRYGEK